jgi:hypothetical protein
MSEGIGITKNGDEYTAVYNGDSHTFKLPDNISLLDYLPELYKHFGLINGD